MSALHSAMYHPTRRTFLAQAVTAWAFGTGGYDRLAAQTQDPEQSADALITTSAQSAIDRGLEYLVERQRPEGYFASTRYGRNVAVASLAGLALLAGGSTPNRGPYGREMQRALDYVLSRARPDGYIIEEEAKSHGPMYGQGFSTLLLAECHGMTDRDDLEPKLRKAVKLILSSQNQEGGWRYDPGTKEADISVTICQIMALRAARNAGIDVPKDPVDRCTEYVRRCQNSDGGFMYQLPEGASDFARSAAGVVALYMAGLYQGPEIRKGLEYLMRFLPRAGEPRWLEKYYYYGHYYAVQAMWHAGGDYWKRWYPAVRDDLINRQQRDGSWQDGFCNEYATAMASITLQIPNNLLPILQR